MKGCVSDTKYLFNKRFISLSGNCYYISGAIGMFLFSCSVMSDSLQPHELQHSRLPCPSPSPSSVQFSCSVMSDSLQPHESQHARPPYHQLPEFTQTHGHRVSDAIQPSISSLVVPFSSCPQSLPASGFF